MRKASSLGTPQAFQLFTSIARILWSLPFKTRRVDASMPTLSSTHRHKSKKKTILLTPVPLLSLLVAFSLLLVGQIFSRNGHMRSAIDLDSLCALSPTKKPSLSTPAIYSSSEQSVRSADPDEEAEERFVRIAGTSSIEDIGIATPTSASSNNTDSNISIDSNSIMSPTATAAATAGAPDKENAANAMAPGSTTGTIGMTSNAKTSSSKATSGKAAATARECSSCHQNLSRPAYSNAQWKKGSNRRCADCVSGTNGATSNSTGSAESTAGAGAGLADRTNGGAAAANSASAASTAEQKKMVSNMMDVERLTMALSFEPSQDNNDTTMKSDGADTAAAIALSPTFGAERKGDDDVNNISILTVEQTPTKDSSFGVVGTFSSDIGGNDEEDKEEEVEIDPQVNDIDDDAQDGGKNEQPSIDTTPGISINTSTPASTSSESSGDAALSSVYSYSLYEAEVSLEHIQSLQDANVMSTGGGEEILAVATDALNLPCFKDEVLAEIMGEKKDDGTGTGNVLADSPIRLNGIDTKHLSHLYSQLQLVAAQSELALDMPNDALERVESALDLRPELSWPYAVELGMVVSDAHWCLGRVDRSEMVKDVLSKFVADEADAAAMEGRGTARAHAEELIVELLDILSATDPVDPPEEEEEADGDYNAPHETTVEDKDTMAIEKNVDMDPVDVAVTEKEEKHVTFDNEDTFTPGSPVDRELVDLNGRRIVTSILKNESYPLEEEEGNEENTDRVRAMAAHDGSVLHQADSSRPDILQHVYNSYRSAYGAGKSVPVAGFFLALAENVASTGIKIGSLGKLSLKDLDETFVGPHLVKGVDDLIVNPIVETVGGIAVGVMHVGEEIAKPVVGAAEAVISVVPFLGNHDEGGEK